MSLNEVLLKLLPLRKIRAMLFSPADCGVPANNFGHNLDPLCGLCAMLPPLVPGRA